MFSTARDTITALSTPPGTSGIAIVRLSGPRALEIAARHIENVDFPRNLCKLLPHAVARLHWLLTANGERLDQAVVLAFHAPHSYTGESVVEFHVHGSPFVVMRLMDELRAESAIAEPGEFTRRAVENGRLSLQQAESVLALIEARSPLAHDLAIRGLSGESGRRVQAAIDMLLDILSMVESDLDFSEHEIEPTPSSELLAASATAKASLQAWRATWRIGRLSAGADIVLAGPPNSGKSTLMNALLGESRVIVDPEPGTTRDLVSQTLRLGDLNVTLWDTAGLATCPGRVESLGVERTRDLLERADLILHLVPPGAESLEELTVFCEKSLLIGSKSDLPTDTQGVRNGVLMSLSAQTGDGMDELRALMLDRLIVDDWRQLDLVLTEARHVQLVESAIESLERFEVGLTSAIDRSFAAADLHDAIVALGGIIGGVDFDDLYPRIFSRFCVGK